MTREPEPGRGEASPQEGESGAGEGPEYLPANSPNPALTEDQARIILARYGGWERLSEGLKSLSAAMDALGPVLREEGDWSAFLEALVLAGHARDRAKEAERALQRAETHPIPGEEIPGSGPGERPGNALVAEVAFVFRDLGLQPGEGNTPETRQTIRERLHGRFSEEELSEDSLAGILQRVAVGVPGLQDAKEVQTS